LLFWRSMPQCPFFFFFFFLRGRGGKKTPFAYPVILFSCSYALGS
jgi:hypothetical protein